MQIGQELQEKARNEPDEVGDVILVFQEYSDRAQGELDRVGFETTSKDQAPFGLIYGRIRLGNIWNLETISGMESVELDSPQYAL